VQIGTLELRVYKLPESWFDSQVKGLILKIKTVALRSLTSKRGITFFSFFFCALGELEIGPSQIVNIQKIQSFALCCLCVVKLLWLKIGLNGFKAFVFSNI
jgi:cytosine/uracil/thiamine/allantoin permease